MAVTIRPAKPTETKTVLDFIYLLAEYEHIAKDYTVTQEVLHDSLFVKHDAYALLAFCGETPVGFALYYYNFSTSMGKRGLYVEDVFVLPQMRGKGIGRRFFEEMARIALDTGCERMEWLCLDWNEPGLRFYQSIKADARPGWLLHRMSPQAVAELAAPGHE